MNVHFAVRRSRWPGRLVQLGVVVVVAAVAAATFMLSYAGVHAVALQAGVPRDLARYYPGILDAVLVIACAAAPVLRDARWWVRCYAWMAILVVIVVIGGIDAVHAMNVALPHRATAGVAAVLPWALLLLAFSLWLTILRHLRAQHLARETEIADVAEVPVARKALEAATPADGAKRAAGANDGPGDEGPGLVAATTPIAVPAAAGAEEAAAPQEPAKEGAAATEAAPPPGAARDGQAPDEEPPGEEPPGEEPPGEEAPGEEAPVGKTGPDESAVLGVNPVLAENTVVAENPVLAENTAAENIVPGMKYEPGTEPAGESEDAPETVTEIPAVTYTTGPRLRRVRSLPAPPVDDEE